MLRPLDEPLPDVEPTPGVDILEWDASRSEAVRVVHNQAFADHWGSAPLDHESWEWNLHGEGSRLVLSFIAVASATGEVVGYSRAGVYPSDFEVTGRRDGWIEQVCVLRGWRRRGVATALLVRTMHAFAKDGLTHVALGVDSDSPTGAPSVYRRVGFATEYRSITHQLKVD